MILKMNTAIDEVVDICNESSSNLKRKLSSSDEISEKKPKLDCPMSGSSSDSDNRTPKSSKNQNLENSDVKRNGLKAISNDSHDGSEAENSITTKSNRKKLKNNDILALLNSSDSDIEHNNSDSNESLTAENIKAKDSGDSSSSSSEMKLLSKQESHLTTKLKKGKEVHESTRKSDSSDQESSDSDCVSDDKPLINSKSKLVDIHESGSEGSDSESCIKSTKDENSCTRILSVKLQKLPSSSSNESIDTSGNLKLTKKTPRIKRNSKPALNIRSKKTINVSTSDSSDDEPLSKASHSRKPVKNAISDDNELLKKSEKKHIQKGISGTKYQRNLKNRENISKQNADSVSDSEEDELNPVKNETSGDTSDSSEAKPLSKVSHSKKPVKSAISDGDTSDSSEAEPLSKVSHSKKPVKSAISDGDTSDSSEAKPLSKVSHSKKPVKSAISDGDELSKKLGNKKNQKGVSSPKYQRNLKYRENISKQNADSASDSEDGELKSVKNEMFDDSEDSYKIKTSKVSKAKVTRKGSERKPMRSSSESNNNNEDESSDSNEEVRENAGMVKLKQEKNDSESSEENHITIKEKSSELKFEKVRSDSDSESSVVSDEDVKDQKLKKIHASKGTKSRSEKAEASDNKGNLKSLVVKHEISSSGSSSDESGTKESPKGNVPSESNQKNGHKKSKKAPEDDKRIINLKKYLHIAGIRPKNYAELWKGCKSNKARASKLQELLEKNGLKGRPSIEKCKKLRIKIEKEKEIAELDLGNILDNGGAGRGRRCTRGVLGNTNSRLSTAAEEKAEELKNRFSRIKALNSSDSESD